MAARSFGPATSLSTINPGPQPEPPVAPPPHTLRASGPRLALLVGNADYPGAGLVNPLRDVALLGEVLASLGFDVTTITDADKSELDGVIQSFAAQLEQAGADAVAFFYFAGHGAQDGSINYLLPIDVKLPARLASADRALALALDPAPRELRDRAVALDQVIANLARHQRKANVIVLDACRKSSSDLAQRQDGVMQGLAALVDIPDGMLVVYATAAGAIADDGPISGNSPYAAALAQELPGLLEPDRRIHDVFVEAAARVTAATAGRQKPALYLQGALPALDVSDADRERFRTWSFRRRKTIRERALNAVGLVAIGFVALLFGLYWYRLYPETRARFLQDAGLFRSDLFDFRCDTGATKPDRFGLTPADWCRRSPLDLIQPVKQAGLWDREVMARLPKGDPKAMTLRAAEIALTRPLRNSPLSAEMFEFSDRAAFSGLASGVFAVSQLVSLQDSLQRNLALELAQSPRILSAAKGGSILAQIVLGYGDYARLDFEKAMQTWTSVEEADESGEAALALGRATRFGPQHLQDVAQAATWFRKSAAKGNLPALFALDQLVVQRKARISNSDMLEYVDRVVLRGDIDVEFWKAWRLLARDETTNAAEAATHLIITAERGHIRSMTALADLHGRGLVSGHPDPVQERVWLSRAANAEDIPSIVRLATDITFGFVDVSGVPTATPDPVAARELWERLVRIGDARGHLQIAEMYEVGGYGAVDLATARRHYASAADAAGSYEIRALAEQALRRLDRVELLAQPPKTPAIEIGRPDAPLRVHVYIRVACTACDDYFAATLDPALSRHITHGLVRLIIRQVYSDRPDQPSAPGEEDAGMTVRCLPPGERLDAVKTLTLSAKKWADISDRPARMQMIKSLLPLPPINEAQFGSCVGDPGLLAGIRDERRVAIRELGIQAHRAVLINGKLLDMPTVGRIANELSLAMPPQRQTELLTPDGKNQSEQR